MVFLGDRSCSLVNTSVAAGFVKATRDIHLTDGVADNLLILEHENVVVE